MSLKTFLSKIWAEVKSLFESLPEELQTAAHAAVLIVENIKTVVDNPAVDIITAIIPGELDNQIITWLRNKLPALLIDLRLTDAASQSGDANHIVSSAIKTIQDLQGDIKNALLHDLGILVAQEVARAENHELKWSDAVYLVEWYYQHKYKSI